MRKLLLPIFFLQFICFYPFVIRNKTTSSYTPNEIKITNKNHPFQEKKDSLIIYSEYSEINSYLWEIGDRIPNGDGLSFQDNCTDLPHCGKTCVKIGYLTSLNMFIGINWLPSKFYEDSLGVNLYNLLNTKDISILFWAKGVDGNEKIKCQVGGNNNHGDTIEFPKGTQPQWISLKKDWTQYKIDLSKANLSNVVTVFSIYLSKDKNWGKDIIHVYLDDIVIKCK